MKKIIATILLIGTVWSIAEAFGSLEARIPGTNSNYTPLWLKTMDATVTINDQIAITYVNQVFSNTGTSTMEGLYTFTLPPGSVITELALWINGVRTVARVLKTTQATSVYDSTVRKAVDPALLEDSAGNNYKIYIYPIGPAGDSGADRRIDFTYVTPLQSAADTTTYTLPLISSGLSSKTPLRTSVTMTGRWQDTIVNVLTPGLSANGIAITRPDLKTFFLSYLVDSAYTNQPLTVSIAGTHEAVYRVKAETYVPLVDSTQPFDSAGDASYFALWLNSPAPGAAKSREVVFVADISFSIGDSGMTLLRTSLLHAVGLLSASDRFNIIAFNTGYTEFMPGLISATATAKSGATAYIDSLKVQGITNPIDPMKAAMAMAWSAGANHAVFLLTDGYPTWPIRLQSAAIIDTITASNGAGVPVFGIGIGNLSNQTFLSLLSQSNNGNAVTLGTADTGQGGLSTVVNQMQYSFLSNLRMGFGTLDTADVYPTQLPYLYNGGEIGILGRYRKSGVFPVTISAAQNGVPFRDTLSITTPVPSFKSADLPQLWASAKVSALETLISQQASSTLDSEVTYLGLRYSIVTPNTSLLVVPGELPPATNVKHGLAANGLIRTMELSASWSALSKKALIRYAVPTVDNAIKRVSLKVYDIRGALVQVLVQRETPGGEFTVSWNGASSGRRFVGSGFYIVVLQVENKRLVQSLHIAR